MAKHKVLSTKKLEPSLIEKAKENNIEIIEQEFISVKPIWSEEKFQEIFQFFQKPYAVFTSANAVAVVDDYLHPHDTFYILNWKIFCLSGKTKKAVLKTLILPKEVVGEAENASALAKKIIEQHVKEVVFFCGNRRREELPSILKDGGVVVHEVVVYENTETPIVVNDDFDAVLFFSPSAVQSFFSVNQLKKKTVCFAIGNTTKHSIAPFTNNQIITSIAPGQYETLEEVIEYFNKKH